MDSALDLWRPGYFELGFFCFSDRVFENGVCSLVLLLGVVNLETVYDKNDRKTIGAITRKSERAKMTKNSILAAICATIPERERSLFDRSEIVTYGRGSCIWSFGKI